MENTKKKSILRDFFLTIGGILIIKDDNNTTKTPEFSDLKDKDFEEEEISKDQRKALEKSLRNLVAPKKPNEEEKDEEKIQIDTKGALKNLSDRGKSDSKGYEHGM